jgi:hypothetical protein
MCWSWPEAGVYIGPVAANRLSAGQKGSHMRISGGLVIRHESHQGRAGSRSGISALPVIGKNLTFIAGYSKILNNFQTWPPVNAKNPTTARA